MTEVNDALKAIKEAVALIDQRDFDYGIEDPAKILAALRERGFDVVPAATGSRDEWIEKLSLAATVDVARILGCDMNEARRLAAAQVVIRATIKMAFT